MAETESLKEAAKEELAESINRHEASISNLLLTILDLVGIVDQTIDKNGMIQVAYQFASERIHAAQLAAKATADELQLMAQNAKDYMEEVEKTEQEGK